MVDRNLRDFHGRLDRIERIHAAGGGFEAEGTLGMSASRARRRPARRLGLFGPVALVALTILALKAAVLATIGPERYAERLADLRAGGTAEQAGAWVLQADPLTVALAERLRGLVY